MSNVCFQILTNQDREAIRCQRSVSLLQAVLRVIHMGPAVQHLTTYWSLLQGIRGSRLKLTRIDDEILETFQKDFPEMDVSATINEDDMKSKEGKERWRNFVNLFDKRIEDFNVGAIVRTSHRTEYTEEGSIFGESFENG